MILADLITIHDNFSFFIVGGAMNPDQSIAPADAILRHLGGGSKLKPAIGARDFSSANGGMSLTFKIGANAKNSINNIKIRLNDMGSYDITFYKRDYKNHKNLTISIPANNKSSFYSGIHVDGIEHIIQEETGLLLNIVSG
jgi:hypothetical protein